MLGAIAGDIIGSPYEGTGEKLSEFPLLSTMCTFTDDTVLTVAVAEAILDGRDFADALREYANRYPGRGYGWKFIQWAHAPTRGPYHSWGNGSAMRVSPVGWAYESVEAVLEQARRSAAVTHNHPHGIHGAQATALALFMARKQAGKQEIRSEIVRRFGYDLGRSVEAIRHGYQMSVSCQGSVPESIIAFLDADSYENSLRNAISLGGDADTMACIAGGIAEAFHGKLPAEVARFCRERLPQPLLHVVDRFRETYRIDT